MRQFAFWTVALLCSCSSKQEKSSLTTVDNDSIASKAISTDTIADIGDKQNPLYGIIYRDDNEVLQLKDFKEVGGSVMMDFTDNLGNYKFGISEFLNNTKHILTFERLIKEPDNPKSKFKILDTLNIDVADQNGYVSYCKCRQDTTFDYEIIALVTAEENKEFYDKIIKAWRADTKTGTIYPIRNLAGINCVNPGYGAD